MIRTSILLATLGVVLLLIAAAACSLINRNHFGTAAFAGSVEQLLERARRLRDVASPTYQEQALAALAGSKTAGEFYRLDDELGEVSILEEPVRSAGSDAFEVVFAYEFDDEELIPARGDIEQQVRDGVLSLRMSGGGDYLRNADPIAVPKDDIGEIAIGLRTQSGKNLRLAWSKETDPEETAKHQIAIPIIDDGKFHTYFLNARDVLRRGLAERDQIRSLRIWPSDVDGDEVDLDFIRFHSKRSRYTRATRGVVHETIAAETRQAIYMLPRQVIEYRLRVPVNEPRLDFGAGVIGTGSRIDFRVAVVAGDQTVDLHAQTLEDSTQWHDSRHDLTRWAGAEVALRLSVDGAPGSVALWSNPVVSGRPAKPLRMILLIEDATRADHLSVYGYHRATSPFKEELMARDGVVFTHAFSQAEKTRPSVPSLMTSLLPTATGVWNFADMLSPEYLTLAEVLRSGGFATGSFVQNGNAGAFAGLHQGFDVAFDPETTGKRPEELLFGDFLWRWMERNRDRNFFLYLHVIDPHGPYDPPEPYDEWYRTTDPGDDPQEIDPSLDAEWVERPTTAGRQALYDGEIRHGDEVLREFFGRIRDASLFDGTLFMMTADHGEHFGEHGVWEHEDPGTTQVTRVPLLLVYPERFAGGQKVDETVQLMDIMPTVLELAQLQTDRIVMQGDSMVGVLEGRDREYWRQRVIVSEEPMRLDKTEPSRNDGLQVFGSLFHRNWHLIASRKFWPGKVIPESLRLRVYDFVDDPAELSPLWRYRPDIHLRYLYTRSMNQLYATDVEAWDRFTNGGQANYQFDPAVLENLKALGYIDER